MIVIVADRLDGTVSGCFSTHLEEAHQREMRSTIARVLFPWKMRQEIAETKTAFLFLSLSSPLGSSYANRRKCVARRRSLRMQRARARRPRANAKYLGIRVETVGDLER